VNMQPTVVEPATVIEGVAAPFDYANVDTDALFPVSADELARREGFGRALFARWREADPGFILNRPEYAAASILVAGPDFGVGSSRETAVWALTGAGFRAVIAPSFGDIFRSNCARNRLLAATLDTASCHALQAALAENPGARLRIDVLGGTVSGPAGPVGGAGSAPASESVYELGIGEFARGCVARGLDEYELLARRRGQIDALLSRRAHLLRPTTDVAGSRPAGGLE
jgi:3-isopropylmalate/(R)-2-methylmalate dehydratase small subunit